MEGDFTELKLNHDLSHEGTWRDEDRKENAFGTPSFNMAEISNNATPMGDGILETLNATANLFLSDAEIMQNATILDDGIQDTSQYFVHDNPPLSDAEIMQNATILDEGIQDTSQHFDPNNPPPCPLCHSELRLFFINFNQKVLLCKNAQCEYPFGHDEVIYVKENEDLPSDAEVENVKIKTKRSSSTATCTDIAATGLSDMDKINKVKDTECRSNPRSETKEYYKHQTSEKKKKMEKCKSNTIEDPKIMKQVEAISKMNMELKKVDDCCLTNEKWIKKLMNLQKSSGMSLLKPEEIKLITQKKPDLRLGELKIDIINSGSQQEMSSIKIEIANDSNPSPEDTEGA